MNFIQIHIVVKNLILIYFIDYVPISMLLFMIYFVITLKTPYTKDMSEVLNDINNEVERVRKTNEEAAEFLKALFEILINNKVAMFVFLMMIFFIPYVRLILFISAFKDYFHYTRQK